MQTQIPQTGLYAGHMPVHQEQSQLDAICSHLHGYVSTFLFASEIVNIGKVNVVMLLFKCYNC